jgi:two-component system CheB/CheR fusion protein
VAALDPAGNVILSNTVFKEIFGETGRDFLAQDPEGRPIPAEELPAARLRRGESFRMEFTVPGPENSRRWYEAIGRPSGSRAQPGDAVLVIHDITDRTLRLVQDQFLALATHELRTPLTALLGSLDLLDRRARRARDPDQLAESAGMAHDAGLKLQRLVNDLVDVGRLTNGKLRLVFVPTDLAAITREAVEMARGTEGEYPLGLEGADGPLTVMGDAVRLRQVLLNLLNNAIIHAPGAPIAVRVRRDGGVAEIQVTDEGPGIAPEALPHLFNRFFQATSTEPPASTGMGLGLYIAREIVDAHGGDIAVASSVGEGATFTVRLPLMEEGEGSGS